MSKEFDKWNEDQGLLNDDEEKLAKLAWNAARDKILEIIKNNIQHGYEEFPGGRNGRNTQTVDAKFLIKQIEKL